MIAGIALVIYLLFYSRKTYNIYVNPEPEYFYKSDAQFQKEQVAKHHPELFYQLVSKQYEQGLINKVEYDKAVESLIKDITI